MLPVSKTINSKEIQNIKLNYLDISERGSKVNLDSHMDQGNTPTLTPKYITDKERSEERLKKAKYMVENISMMSNKMNKGD